LLIEEVFREVANAIATIVELGGAIVVAIGAIEAFVLIIPAVLAPRRALGVRREAWRRFATWLVLALEFELGADIIRSAVAPSWSDIGQLAAIAAIRTFLNYTLEMDIERTKPRKSAEA
jgi:uncharacterized membrane protein